MVHNVLGVAVWHGIHTSRARENEMRREGGNSAPAARVLHGARVRGGFLKTVKRGGGRA